MSASKQVSGNSVLLRRLPLLPGATVLAAALASASPLLARQEEETDDARGDAAAALDDAGASLSTASEGDAGATERDAGATDGGAQTPAENGPPPTPGLRVRLGGNGVYRWTTRFELDVVKAPAASWMVLGEAQRDFFRTEASPGGKEAARLASIVQLYQAAFEVKGSYFPGTHQFVPPEQEPNPVFVDMTGVLILPDNPLRIQARAGGNVEHGDRWNAFGLAFIERAFTMRDVGSSLDLGTFNFETFGMIPIGDSIGDSTYKTSYQIVSTYAMPEKLPFPLGGFNFLYGYAPDFGNDTPYGNVGFSKGTELARFRKGLWADHTLGAGWGMVARDVDLGFVTLPFVRTGFLVVWSPSDGYKGPRGSLKDFVPTLWDDGLGDVAFSFWWLDVGFDTEPPHHRRRR